jgi:D-alanyl-D-alanine carboxypeptidase
MRDHFFDWNGFRFATELILAIAVAATLGYVWFVEGDPSQTPTLAALQVVSFPGETFPFAFSTTTSQRVINSLSVADAVPSQGKFIVADLEKMLVHLYEDGELKSEYPILTKGRSGTPYETPAGFYSVLHKENNHFNSRERLYLPYSMQFYGNYFIHGWPYHINGTPVASTFSGGCIRLSTPDAKRVYDFAEKGTGLFVYDPVSAAATSSLPLSALPAPIVSADSYLVADIDTGEVYLEQDSHTQRPIASITKLMTALVANETIMYSRDISISQAMLLRSQATSSSSNETFVIGELLYPMLMESNNAVAERIAAYYGVPEFIKWMNATARSLDMASTHFTDATGISAQNLSTAEDLYRLAAYLTQKKAFIFNISRTPEKRIVADSGSSYRFSNFNLFSDSSEFIGGKVGSTPEAGETMVSVFNVPTQSEARRIAIIVLHSKDYAADTKNLLTWFTDSARFTVSNENTACVTCAKPYYRKIK